MLGSKKVPIVNHVRSAGRLRRARTKNRRRFLEILRCDERHHAAASGPAGPGWARGSRQLQRNQQLHPRVSCEWTFENGLTGVNSTLELARPASEIGSAKQHEPQRSGVALKLPVKVRLENPLLALQCYVGSKAAPIIWNLTVGKTNPPAPNKPIKGSAGVVEFFEEGLILKLNRHRTGRQRLGGSRSRGCGGIFSFILDPIINASVGAAGCSGHNTRQASKRHLAVSPRRGGSNQRRRKSLEHLGKRCSQSTGRRRRATAGSPGVCADIRCVIRADAHLVLSQPMAQRIPRDESLSRVHGVGALFAAAYGNVGSSIYYALGVTAAFALGLTPVAFVISGLIFAATAATYAEATVMFPEAGGSSSFARHAFNELVSFIAAWGQMLNYTITVAISAFFVPHYLAVFWALARQQPGRHHRRRGPDPRPRPDQHPRHRGVGEAQPDPRRRRPRHPGRAGRDRPRPRPQPAGPGRQHPPRRRPDLERLRARHRGRDDRLHRHRDDLQHGRGGQGRGARRSRAASASRSSRCSASTC